jgi:hypothetical protein
VPKLLLHLLLVRKPSEQIDNNKERVDQFVCSMLGLIEVNLTHVLISCHFHLFFVLSFLFFVFLFSDPYIMAKVRLQARSPSGAPAYTGTLDVIFRTFRSEGIPGLYTGLQAQMLKSVLGTALVSADG